MNYELPDDTKLLRDMARKFAAEKIRPHARDWDREGTIPQAVLKEIAELGFMGVLVPAEYDGAGINYLGMTVIMEELARQCGGTALVLAAHKAGHITVLEPNDARREVVESMGSFHVAASDDGLGNGFDLVIDAVGYAATRATASAAVKPGGVIMHIGLGSGEGGLDVRRMTLQEITFIGTYTYTPADFAETARAIFDGRLGALDWMDVRPMAEGFGAFRDIRSGKVAAPKIILKP
jgi:alkylation response protein AidB-like acyl-CoA dehydrogenase